MKKSQSAKIAFVLAGGGARGALQVGAMRALLEAGIHPDLMVGSSIGAVNAAFIGLHGFSDEALQALESAWIAAAGADLLPPNPVWITMRVLLNRVRMRPYHRVKDFLISQGLTPEMHFCDLQGPKPILVSSELNSGQPVCYGDDPQDSVLEGVLASAALPPWIHPIETEDRFLMDGGALSNLAIEPAMLHGATEIYALNLPYRGDIDKKAHGFGPFWSKLLSSVMDRQVYLELQLAREKGIPVRFVELSIEPPIPVWDFSQPRRQIDAGYQQMKTFLDAEAPVALAEPSNWFERFSQSLSSSHRKTMEPIRRENKSGWEK